MKRVLICDDEPQILRALTVVLRDAGFQAVPTATAEEAIGAASLRPLDAAMIDLLLPGGDGVDVCRHLRERSDLPIVVISGISDERMKIRALEAVAGDYVTKAFTPPGGVAASMRRAQRSQGPQARTPKRSGLVDGASTSRTIEVQAPGR